MAGSRRAERALAAVLLVAAVRGLALELAPPPADLLDPVGGADGVLPDLDHDGWIPLSWLPGVGADRARQVVAQRAQLGLPLTPARLRLLDGIGDQTALEVEQWYRRAGRGPPLEPG